MARASTSRHAFRTLALIVLTLAIGLAGTVVLLFCWAAIPALLMAARGGTFVFWSFGSGHVVVTAALFLAVVLLCARRRRSQP
jgi:hypothetical protein